MTIGAGFMLDAMRRAREFERAMTVRTERPRVRLHGSPAPDEEPFACSWVCTGCGLLRDAAPARDEADAPCGHCRARAWLDLRSFRNAQLLRESEERMRHEGPPWVQQRVRTASRAAGVALGGATALALAAFVGPVALVPIAVIAAASGGAGAVAVEGALGRSLSRWLLSRSPVGPARWYSALPKPDLVAPVVQQRQGVARASGELLHAPLSGRPCLAYEVGVVFDADGDAYPPIWALREDRNAAFEVDGLSLPPDSIALELPLHAAGQAALAKPPGELERFLRVRGLFLADGTFEFFEAVLPPDADVVLTRHGLDAVPWVVRTPADTVAADGAVC